MPSARERLLAPSEWDVVLAPELASLFVLDAALVAAHRVFSICLDPTSSSAGGANHPPTRDLLDAMRILRLHIHQHRLAEATSDEMNSADKHRDPF
jgi:hypothetical protein